MNVRCVTINVAGLGFGWFEGRAEALLAGLRRLDADVLCLQEAVVRSDERPCDQALHLAEGLGLASVAFASYGNPGEIDGPRQSGVALVARWPLRHTESRQLPVGHDDFASAEGDRHVALFATLATPEGDLHVANTHLHWRPHQVGERRAQMHLVLDHMRARGWLEDDAATLLACDLNAEETEPVYEMVTASLVDAWRVDHPQRTGHTWANHIPYTASFAHLPSRRLDYVFVPRGAKVRHAAVVLDAPDPVYVSDHFGVLADVTL